MAVGHRAGVVREGDRRFDIVVKLDRIDGDLDRVRKVPDRDDRRAPRAPSSSTVTSSSSTRRSGHRCDRGRADRLAMEHERPSASTW